MFAWQAAGVESEVAADADTMPYLVVRAPTSKLGAKAWHVRWVRVGVRVGVGVRVRVRVRVRVGVGARVRIRIRGKGELGLGWSCRSPAPSNR